MYAAWAAMQGHADYFTKNTTPMEEIKKLRFASPDKNGWEFPFDFLKKIKSLSEEETDLEEIQSILIALCNIA